MIGNGGESNGTTVSFDAVESGGTATVTGTITGTEPPKLFSDIQVTGP